MQSTYSPEPDSLYSRSTLLELDGARVCAVAFDAPATGNGRRVLLLHGNPAHLDHFKALAPVLSRFAQVSAFDHPGLGRSSDVSKGTVTLERSAHVALAVLTALGVGGAVDVIGHSHGGMVAVAMASLAPERVRSLVLLGTGGTPAHAGYRLMRAIPGLAAALPALGKRLFRAPRLRGVAGALLARAGRQTFFPDPTPPGFIDEQRDELGARPEVLGTMVRLSLDDPCAKVAEHARRVRAPVLVLHGQRDALVHVSYARRLFAILRDASPFARFVEIAGGHMAPLMHPERVAPLLEEWLADA
jgi:pimeloyl-ACP methyl ester carboxylesterase